MRSLRRSRAYNTALAGLLSRDAALFGNGTIISRSGSIRGWQTHFDGDQAPVGCVPGPTGALGSTLQGSLTISGAPEYAIPEKVQSDLGMWSA
jgi:hypothetical protein